MGEALAVAPINRETYLAWEAEQAEKHEFVAGEIFATVGVWREHALVAGGIHAQLRAHLKGTRCQTFVADLMLFVAAADAYFYPDVMVSCDEHDRSADLAIEHPCLVVEVLSDSTSAYDRGTKFAAYRKLASLNEYLLIDIDARRLELYRREADHWQFFEASLGEPPLLLQSVGLDLSAEEVFEDLAE